MTVKSSNPHISKYNIILSFLIHHLWVLKVCCGLVLFATSKLITPKTGVRFSQSPLTIFLKWDLMLRSKSWGWVVERNLRSFLTSSRQTRKLFFTFNSERYKRFPLVEYSLTAGSCGVEAKGMLERLIMQGEVSIHPLSPLCASLFYTFITRNRSSLLIQCTHFISAFIRRALSILLSYCATFCEKLDNKCLMFSGGDIVLIFIRWLICTLGTQER